ncbi:MAG: hypothetical protein ACLFMT_07735 [Halobacteriales archaeon]
MKRTKTYLAVSIAALLMATAFAAGTTAAQTDSNTSIEIQIDENGDATWTVTSESQLESEDEVDGFERIVEDRTRRSEIGEDVTSRFDAFADRAEEEVDREMQVGETEVGAELEDDVGVVTVEFDWTAFASTEDGSVVAGDVFAGGLSLDEDTSLSLVAPENYVVDDSDAEGADVSDTSVTWNGPTEFEDDVVVRFVASEDTDGDGAGSEGLPGFTTLAALTALSGFSLLVRRRRSD